MSDFHVKSMYFLLLKILYGLFVALAFFSFFVVLSKLFFILTGTMTPKKYPAPFWTLHMILAVCCFRKGFSLLLKLTGKFIKYLTGILITSILIR